MAVIWNQLECDVRTVHTQLSSDKTFAYTTIMTVMNRLVEKMF